MGRSREYLGERLVDSCEMLKGFCWNVLPGILGALTALVVMSALLYYPYKWSFDDGKFPEFSVAVASVNGLDPERDLGRSTLDPTFDLTVRIKEPRKYRAECLERGTTAAVSYRGVQLASGPMPELCGKNEDTTEARSVMAWGHAKVVPEFARERLAEELRRGDAEVDVTLTTPARYCTRCLQTVIECKPRVGSGEFSPRCGVTRDFPTIPGNPDVPYPQYPGYPVLRPERRFLR
uniref:Late embryogenesis abundant protein LEA-2 subgroup domain-containing protein n=1 Tax=Oryza punctata TaxID=4537 RepID=A0A0E0K2I6_ORYPU